MAFGFYSLYLGADSNYDLRNYHLYNPFAWLNNKLLIDFAPAGMQTYFNPMLDLLPYWMNRHLPSRVVGFFLGMLHGTSFVLLLEIARRSQPSHFFAHNGNRAPILIAAAGCLTANFLSGIGNSMGDDTTALFILSGVLVVVANWDLIGKATLKAYLMVLVSGVFVGLGAGLKLTNVPYAAALCLSLLCYPTRVLGRLRLSFLFGLGTVAGFAMSGGYWLFHMWEIFGNPLYPQYGAIFHNPYAQSIGKADLRWGAHGLLEIVFWPFILAANSHRVSELTVRQIIWPIVYILFCWWAVSALVARLKRTPRAHLEPRARFIIFFVGLGFLLWMGLFSIYRYIVPIEVLAPLVVVLLLNHLLTQTKVLRASFALLGVATALVITGGYQTWGHEGWADPLYHAQVPVLDHPERTTIITAGGEAGWGWLTTLFPPTVAFAQIESSFPATTAFNDRIRTMSKARGGPIYALIKGSYNFRIDNIANANRFVDAVGFAGTARGCGILAATIARFHLHARVAPASATSRTCQLELRADDVHDTVAENRALAIAAAAAYSREGFLLNAGTCVQFGAGIGKGREVYQLCRLSLSGA
ncbi:hypothetical protein LMG28138_01128 [Pararobbsia alpina]|uniref:Glycosyltransferase RgtA/B/C/D-like domain-containing protein n=1 Tax=Pararobbsia alpina TaxID=621374 RepID=A0A6S7CIF2_9BURK|nr:hypothetical protein LMG28138_01128 [Pararobbsia alpina]